LSKIEIRSKEARLTSLLEEITYLKLQNLDEIEKLEGILEIGRNVSLEEKPIKDKIPYFMGCLVSDKEGKTLLTFEIYEGALEYFLRKDMNDEERKRMFDITLISMFVSAIEKFSEEINIQDLSGLNLKGISLKMQILRFDRYNIIFFVNPDANFRFVEDEVNNFFINLINDNKKNFEDFIKYGIIFNVTYLENSGKKLLEELNKKYEQKIINLEIFDFDSIKTHYYTLNGFYDKINLNFFVILEKIKKMKIKLRDAIQENNHEIIKEITHNIQEVNLILKIKDRLID